jgi:hypothetical protein
LIRLITWGMIDVLSRGQVSLWLWLPRVPQLIIWLAGIYWYHFIMCMTWADSADNHLHHLALPGLQIGQHQGSRGWWSLPRRRKQPWLTNSSQVIWFDTALVMLQKEKEAKQELSGSLPLWSPLLYILFHCKWEVIRGCKI